MKSRARSIDTGDRKRILRALGSHKPDDFEALRTAALVELAWGSALRVAELCALQLGQVAELGPNGAPKVRALGQVTREQAKGGKAWSSAGQFVVTPRARRALKRYLVERDKRGYVLALDAPLFVPARRRGPTLTPRTALKAWVRVQRRASVRELYRFHDLRHDAVTRFADACNGNPFRVAQYGRFRVSTAFRYVHGSMQAIGALAEVASRG